MSRQIVQSVLDKYSHALIIEKDRLAERRVQFIPHIIRALGNPKWGYLIKTGGKVQDDIVVDKTTMHHYDVLSAVDEDGKYKITSVWKDQGIVPGKWKWGAVGEYLVAPLPNQEVEPDPIPNPDPIPEPNPNLDLEGKINRILNQQEEILFLLKRVFK